jgi:TnpA family transposase
VESARSPALPPKYGQATASLIVGKWSASSRQNTLAAALKEWGTLRRTIHAA